MPTSAEQFYLNYDTFLTTTLKNYSKTLEKNFLQYRPEVEILFNNYAKSDTRGGRFWQGMAEYGQSTTVKFFNGPDAFSQEPGQFALPIMYQWRYMGGSVSMARTEALENSGPAALADITEGRVNQVMRTMNLILANEIWSDGTNYGGLTIEGLAKGIPTNNTTSLGGLNPATQTFWRNNFQTSCGSFAANGVNGTVQDLVLTMFNNCTDGMIDRPTDIISSQDVFEYYNRTNTQLVRYIREGGDQSSADLTIRPQGLEYQGIRWVWSRQCPAGTLYMLNRNYVYFQFDPRFKFEWTNPLTYPNQFMFTRLVGLRLFLNYTARMYHAVMNGWTA